SRANDVMKFERLVELVEPFGPVGRAAAAAFVQRQLQLAQQAGDFLAGGDMSEARTGAERGLVEVVERGQAARKELAIDHPLREAVDRTEPEPERQVVEAFGDELLVTRAEQRQAVANHDPVAARAVELAALAPA